MQKVVDEARAKGAQVVVLLSHNGMDVDLKMASRVRGIDAILGGHTHDGVPQPTSVEQRRRHDAGHQRRQQRQVPRRARSRRARAARSPTTATGCCRCSRTCCRPTRRWTRYIARVRAPYEAQACARSSRSPRACCTAAATSTARFDQLICDALMEVQGARDRVLARLPLGHDAAARPGDHDGAT